MKSVTTIGLYSMWLLVVSQCFVVRHLPKYGKCLTPEYPFKLLSLCDDHNDQMCLVQHLGLSHLVVGTVTCRPIFPEINSVLSGYYEGCQFICSSLESRLLCGFIRLQVPHQAIKEDQTLWPGNSLYIYSCQYCLNYTLEVLWKHLLNCTKCKRK